MGIGTALQGGNGKILIRYIQCFFESFFAQVIDGYFVHFTEDQPDLEALPKYTVFVLDVSFFPSSSSFNTHFNTYFVLYFPKTR